jgi:response regulator RpfG family c-di-GMP phosphodiesterase
MTERILVVDDEEAIREIVSFMLVDAGYKCRQAGSGDEALAVLDSGEHFDLISTDIIMADLDGFGLLERVKVQYAELPVVFVTSIHDASLALASFRSGVYDYLMEPFECSQLLTTIRRALENHRLRTETDADKTTLASLVVARTKELRGKLSKLDFSDEEAVTNALPLDGEGMDYRFDSVLTSCTVGIAGAMGFPDEQIKGIARGAAIHDVGQVPALCNILSQPADLLPDELALMCNLCHDIHEMLSPIPFLADASETVYAYQESFDGTGYPRGLKGDEIPLGARILSVALLATAITSWGASARPLSSAHPEIELQSGHRFDPEVVRIVLSMSDTTWENLGKKISPL